MVLFISPVNAVPHPISGYAEYCDGGYAIGAYVEVTNVKNVNETLNTIVDSNGFWQVDCGDKTYNWLIDTAFTATITNNNTGWTGSACGVVYGTSNGILNVTLCSPGNTPPNKPTNPSPTNNKTGLSTSVTLKVDVTDPDNDTMNVSFYSRSGELIGIHTNVANGSTASVTWSGLKSGTLYRWYAITNDLYHENISNIFKFTTKTSSSSGGGGGGVPPPPVNIEPSADIGGPYGFGYENSPFYFDGTLSDDTDGEIVSWIWNFGDGSTGEGETTSHTYTTEGEYYITLTVTDNGGLTDVDTVTIKIYPSPSDDDNDGYTNDMENFYGTDPQDPNNSPIDTDNDGTPDEDSDKRKYIGDSDDDNDGLDDLVEIEIGSDPKKINEWKYIENILGYIIDLDDDGQYDNYYNISIGINTSLKYNEDGTYQIDDNGDGKWNYIYNPASGETTTYKTKKTDDNIPWIPLIIIIIVLSIIIIIVVLFKSGYLYIE